MPEVKETFKQTNSKEKELMHHAATQKTDNATDPTPAKASKPAAPKTQPAERTSDWAVLDFDEEREVQARASRVKADEEARQAELNEWRVEQERLSTEEQLRKTQRQQDGRREEEENMQGSWR
jgi:hypothetical protein